MIYLLLFLLLPGVVLATEDEVCLSITGKEITTNIPNMTVTDVNAKASINCLLVGLPCAILCERSAQALSISGTLCQKTVVNVINVTYNFNINGTHCNVFPCKGPAVLSEMKELKSGSSGPEELWILLYIRRTCPKVFVDDKAVKQFYIGVEKQIISGIMGSAELNTQSSKYYNMTELSLNVINITESNLNATKASSSIQIHAPQLQLQNKKFLPEIWMPVDALQDIPAERRVITVVSYISETQFQFKKEDIASMVIRIELLNETLTNLKTPIKMIFRNIKVAKTGNGSQLLCHYFFETGFVWKTEGCSTYNETNGSLVDIICECDHATPFAVLLIKDPISEIHWKILSYISYIGCGVSAFFTALSLVIYVFSRNPKMDFSICIHVSLSGALFLLNTTFLLTEWGATVEPGWVCVLVAALMHYSLLCCFTWMAIEALHLYLLLIKVFNTQYKHYLVKLSLAGWGVPGVVVGISLGLKDITQFYGVTEMTMSDTNQTNSICWITDRSFFYSVNLVYFTLIFIFNTGILVAVAFSICKMKHVFRNKSQLGADAKVKPWRDPKRLNESCRGGVTVLGLTCLMGTTWGLAFLSSGYINYPILYLFCILNSTQGFFIFLWICLSAKKQRKRAMEDRLSSTPVKTGIKFE